MEIKAELLKPYTEDARVAFIVEQNHQKGYEIKETETALEAWGQTAEEVLTVKREAKNTENTTKAKAAVEDGYVVFKEAEFETNSQTVSDLTATMLIMQQAGMESYDWLSKDDKIVTLTLEDFGTLGALIATYKNTVWNVKYIGFKQQIAEATTAEEIDAIVIDYDVPTILTLMAEEAEEAKAEEVKEEVKEETEE